MRALEPEVVDAVWAAVEPLLPPPKVREQLPAEFDRLFEAGSTGRMRRDASQAARREQRPE